METQKQRLLEAAQELPDHIEITFRSMFGGACAYANGRVFAILMHDVLALKLPTEEHAALLSQKARLLQFDEDGPVMKSYLVIPASMKPERLEHWVQRSVSAALKAPPPKPRRPKLRGAKR